MSIGLTQLIPKKLGSLETILNHGEGKSKGGFLPAWSHRKTHRMMGPTGQVSVVQSAFNRGYPGVPVVQGNAHKLETGEIPFLTAGYQGRPHRAGSADLPPLVPILGFSTPNPLHLTNQVGSGGFQFMDMDFGCCLRISSFPFKRYGLVERFERKTDWRFALIRWTRSDWALSSIRFLLSVGSLARSYNSIGSSCLVAISFHWFSRSAFLDCWLKYSPLLACTRSSDLCLGFLLTQ